MKCVVNPIILKVGEIENENEKFELAVQETSGWLDKDEDEADKGNFEENVDLDFCFTMRNTLQEENLKEKFVGGEEEKTEAAVIETFDGLVKNQKNQLPENEDFDAKPKELVAWTDVESDSASETRLKGSRAARKKRVRKLRFA